MTSVGVAGVELFAMRIASLILVPLALYGAASAVHAQRPSTQEYLFPKDGGIYVGADYYPEHWPEERWETDLRMMKEAGFNIVRVAEFSWILFEPEEGKYEFDWLDRWLKLAEKYDIKVIVGTPTAIMPAWLAQSIRKRWK